MMASTKWLSIGLNLIFDCEIVSTKHSLCIFRIPQYDTLTSLICWLLPTTQIHQKENIISTVDCVIWDRKANTIFGSMFWKWRTSMLNKKLELQRNEHPFSVLLNFNLHLFIARIIIITILILILSGEKCN